MFGSIKEAPAAAIVPLAPIISNAVKNRRSKHSPVPCSGAGEFCMQRT
jgi:hypothetical protein